MKNNLHPIFPLQCSRMVLLFGMPNMGEMIFLVVIILLLFGGKKLPELARGLGAGIYEFRRGMNQGNPPVEAQEHVPERDITPHTHEREESHRVKAIPEPKARGGRPSARRSAATKKKGAKKK